MPSWRSDISPSHNDVEEQLCDTLPVVNSACLHCFEDQPSDPQPTLTAYWPRKGAFPRSWPIGFAVTRTAPPIPSILLTFAGSNATLPVRADRQTGVGGEPVDDAFH